MKLLSVIPLTKQGVGVETLSYYSAREVTPGALVTIPLRSRSIPGLVVEVREVGKEKAALKDAGFAMRKIDAVVAKGFFLPEFIAAAHTLALEHASHPGAVLSAFSPRAVTERADALSGVPCTTTPKKVRPLARILQAERADRLAHYRSLVREQFARGASVFLLVPTMQDGERVFDDVSRGIEDRSYFFSSMLTGIATRSAWKRAVESKTPVLIVATYSFLSLPRGDIGLFIVEREASSAYKLRERPHFDVRAVVESIAREFHTELLYADSLMRMETLYRYHEHELEELVRPKMRREFPSSFEIVSMRTSPGDEPMPLISERMEHALRETLAASKSAFVWTVRKGFAPHTVCRDCGASLVCSACDAPLVLHVRGEAKERVFACHRCGKTRPSQTTCDTCGSWRLEAYGAGIDRVEVALRDLFPDTKLFRMDSDSLKTPVQAKKRFSEWCEAPGSILLGTEMALPHIATTGVDLACAVSLDSLIAIPDFRMSEKILQTLSDIREATRDAVIVQTRSPEFSALTFCENGDSAAWYRHEKESRERFSYPPFAVAIKVSRRGDRKTVTADLEALAERVAPRDANVYPAFVAVVKNVFHAHVLITVPRDTWPDTNLLELLRALPPSFDVDVEPQSFL